MSAPKSRITALDWAKTQARNELKSLIAHYVADCPSGWKWRLSSMTRDDPNVLLSIDDTEFGFTNQMPIPAHLPLKGMWELVQSLFEKTAFQRHQIAEVMKRRHAGR